MTSLYSNFAQLIDEIGGLRQAQREQEELHEEEVEERTQTSSGGGVSSWTASGGGGGGGTPIRDFQFRTISTTIDALNLNRGVPAEEESDSWSSENDR